MYVLVDNPGIFISVDWETRSLSYIQPCVLKAYNVNRPHLEFNFLLQEMAPNLAKPAPQFSGTAVVNGQFKDIKLDDFKGKYLVLFFYPLDL